LETSKLEAGNGSFSDIGLYSYGSALLAYTLLTILALVIRRYNPVGNALFAASAVTAVWAGSVTLSTLLPTPQTTLIQLAEFARNTAWALVLVQLLRLRLVGSKNHLLTRHSWPAVFAAFFGALLAILLAAGPLQFSLSLSAPMSSNLTFGTWLVMSVLGLLLLEQFFRNSNENELWPVKHLCIGLGILFIYDFFMYAEALLFRHLDRSLWQARGVVTTLGAILMIISLSRTDRSGESAAPRGFHPSRHVAFHSLTLMASGLYLIGMALAAYFIRYLGGSWGGVLQIAFLCAAGLVLVMLLFSGQIRARARVWLSKNFFSYKYDYRLEWLQFTRTLASGDTDIPHDITRAIANLAKSPGGVLWAETENGHFSCVAHLEMPDPRIDMELGSLPVWLQAHQWIIDLNEWRKAPDIYRNLDLPAAVARVPRAWLIIPLVFGEHLQGILMLKESELLRELNWEDRDLLKVASRQAASHLAQYQADKALVESRQFEAFNRLSAYVIHDLKNILAQLSLMVSNAQKHKHNPEFVDDMIETVSNSVSRMNNLMVQLRSGALATETEHFDLAQLLEAAVAECAAREPVPRLSLDGTTHPVNCERERLHTVFCHLIHNAQDAAGKRGRVDVRLCDRGGSAVVEIEDDGAGMDEQFIRERLFKPFDSTKGLTGMGIGAFESRDFIRSIGGDIGVSSSPGEGSLFQVRIPAALPDTDND